MKKKKLKNIFGKEVNVIIVDKQEDANFITHSGTFHADDVMATCLLTNLYDEIKLFRTNKVNNKNAFIYDIGFGKYDHHQNDFNDSRSNGIRYASSGLIWKDFGKKIVDKLDIKNKDELFNSIDKNIIMDIDRDDNGIELDKKPSIKQQTISNIVSSFNPSWNSCKDENECFLEALCTVNIIFNNMVEKMIAKEDARLIIEERIDKSENHILILDRYMPWKDILLTSNNPIAKEILYTIFPSKRGGYNIVATPISLSSFDVRKPFPKKWAGKEDEELRKISGIDTITFCHKGLFICACNTYDDAIKIANIAIND